MERQCTLTASLSPAATTIRVALVTYSRSGSMPMTVSPRLVTSSSLRTWSGLGLGLRLGFGFGFGFGVGLGSGSSSGLGLDERSVEHQGGGGADADVEQSRVRLQASEHRGVPATVGGLWRGTPLLGRARCATCGVPCGAVCH